MEKTYTIKEVIQKFKFDKRRKWFVFSGNIVYDYQYTMDCSRCDGGGCHECGYTGKRRRGCPVPFINPETGNPLRVKAKDFKKIVFPTNKTTLTKQKQDDSKRSQHM